MHYARIAGNVLNDIWLLDSSLDEVFGKKYRHSRMSPCFVKTIVRDYDLGSYSRGYRAETLARLLLSDRASFEAKAINQKQELKEWKEAADKLDPRSKQYSAHLEALFRLGLADRLQDVQLAEMTAADIPLESGKAFGLRHGRGYGKEIPGQIWTYSFCFNRWVNARAIAHCRFCDECVDGTRHWHCSACKTCCDDIWKVCKGCGGKSGIWYDEALATVLELECFGY